jgi:superkiller protein 3
MKLFSWRIVKSKNAGTAVSTPLVMLLVASLAVSCASTEDKTRESLLQGDRLIAEGKCDEAIRQYTTAAKLSPGSADIHLKLARTHARCGAGMAAVQEYQKAVSHGAPETETYREMVPLLIRLGNFQAAQTILKRIISKAPSDCVAYNNLGVVLYRQKKYREARAAFEKAIKAKPSHCDSYLNLAVLLENEFDDLALATKHYRKYLALNPDAPNAAQIRDRIVQNELKLLEEGVSGSRFDEYMQQGTESLADGDFNDAEKAFRSALRARPSSVSALENLGVALMEQGELGEAKSMLNKCLELDGGSAGCAYQLGWVHQLSGNTKEAVSLWKKALRIDPTFIKAKRTLELYDK